MPFELSPDAEQPLVIYVYGIERSESLDDLKLVVWGEEKMGWKAYHISDQIHHNRSDVQVEEETVRRWWVTDEEPINVVQFRLKEISFGGNHTIRTDSDDQDYVAPHWKDMSVPPNGDAEDVNDRHFPVAYAFGERMRVTSARWEVKPSWASALLRSVKVQADGPGSYDFPEVNASIEGSDIVVADMDCAVKFDPGSGVQYFNPMVFEWNLSCFPSRVPMSGGTSNNRVYVVFSAPTVAPLFETVIDVACRRPDIQGKTDPNEIFSCIWLEFSSSIITGVKRKAKDGYNHQDGTPLKYYATKDPEGENEVALLLKNANGRCGAWAYFLLDATKAHGLSGPDVRGIYPATFPPGWPSSASMGTFTTPHSLWVKNCDFSKETAVEIQAPIGIRGQGMETPKWKWFGEHAVVRLGNYLFDPSYGQVSNGLLDFQQKSIAAVMYTDPEKPEGENLKPLIMGSSETYLFIKDGE